MELKLFALLLIASIDVTINVAVNRLLMTWDNVNGRIMFIRSIFSAQRIKQTYAQEFSPIVLWIVVWL